MKRNGDDRPGAAKDPSGAPAKSIRRQKESSSTRERETTESGKKPGKGSGDEEKRPGSEEQAAAESSFPPPEGAVGLPPDEVMEGTWDVAASEFSGWWWWGVEEEVLLGWFPFADEHFLCSENRGLLWAEEEVELDDDIWQLRRIHDIPSTAK